MEMKKKTYKCKIINLIYSLNHRATGRINTLNLKILIYISKAFYEMNISQLKLVRPC